MELIHANKLSFKYETQPEPVLENVSFRVDSSSRIGLIGNNGCGKSTLFDLMRGQLVPGRGHLTVRDECVIGHLPQEVGFDDVMTTSEYLWQARPNLDKLRQALDCTDPTDPAYASLTARFYESGGGLFEAHVARIVAGFRFDTQMLALPIASLSGGEKTKAGLARLLLSDADCLLLDEPTNHLEIESLEWLESYLAEAAVPFVVISHDRRFLDNCVKEIWELADGRLTVQAGNYSAYRERKKQAFHAQQESYEQATRTVKRLREAASARRQRAQKSESFKSTRSVSKKGSVQKRDAGSGRGRASSSGQMKAARSIEKRIERLAHSERSRRPFVEKERKIDLGERSLDNPVALTVSALSMSFGGGDVFKDLTLSVASGSKLGVIGRNGSGKTTLLKIVAGALGPTAGDYHWAPKARIGYYSQEHETLDANRTILEEVLDGRVAEQALARTILGRLQLRRDKVFQTIGSLSLGERSKTALAKILFSNANVLVLDEPTNHMELQAREALEKALEEFSGTLILASHDRFLLSRVVTEIFDVEAGVHFPGTYDEYVASGRRRDSGPP